MEYHTERKYSDTAGQLHEGEIAIWDPQNNLTSLMGDRGVRTGKEHNKIGELDLNLEPCV